MKNVIYLLIAFIFLACEEESELTLESLPGSPHPTIGIQPSDILVAYHWGNTNVCYPCANGDVPLPYKDSVLTSGSTSFIWNQIWPVNYNYNSGCFGAETSYIFKMDSVFPGQIRAIRHNTAASRLREDIRTNVYDWNALSTGENWDRSKLYAFGKGLMALKNQFPNSKIRLISIVPFITEDDSYIITTAGDSPTITNDEAKATYVDDMKAIYNAMVSYAVSLGIDTEYTQLQMIETGPGFQVLNRPLNKGIQYAQYQLTSEIPGSELVSTCGIDMLPNGVNYSPVGHVELGKRLAEIDINRLK